MKTRYAGGHKVRYIEAGESDFVGLVRNGAGYRAVYALLREGFEAKVSRPARVPGYTIISWFRPLNDESAYYQ